MLEAGINPYQAFKSHLYGIEIWTSLTEGKEPYGLNRTFMELKSVS